MGGVSGKGSPKYWIIVIKPEKIFYEMVGVSEKYNKKGYFNSIIQNAYTNSIHYLRVIN